MADIPLLSNNKHAGMTTPANDITSSAGVSKFDLASEGCLNIVDDRIEVSGVREKPFKFSDIGGASVDGKEMKLHVFEIHKKLRKQCDYLLVFPSVEQAALARRSVINALDGRALESVIPRRNLLVLINPFSGTQKAVKVWKIVSDIITMRGATLDVVKTTHAGHAIDVCKELSLAKYDGIISVSGDGLIYEIIQGLMQHMDAANAIKIPLGLIPAGTGNGVAYSMCLYAEEPYSAVCSALIILRGDTVPFDLAEVTQSGEQPKWSFLGLYWAAIADIDLESEACRWCGSMRNDFYAIRRLCCLRRYHGKLKYRLGDGEFKVIDDEFTLFTAVNVTWIDEGTYISPHVRPDSGYWDILIMRKPSKCTMLCGMLNIESGEPLSGSEILRVSEFILEPEPYSTNTPGNLDVDGERIPYKKTAVKIHAGLANIMGKCTLPLPADSRGLPEYSPRQTSTIISTQPTSRVVKLTDV